jgi:hypothetical protein
MTKRNRTKLRFEGMYSLAVTSHINNWSEQKTVRELEEVLAKNADLVDEGAKNTARLEFSAMADSSLRGALPTIRCLTERLMDSKPPGAKQRFQHEFLKLCRQARKIGVAAVKREVEQRLQTTKA